MIFGSSDEPKCERACAHQFAEHFRNFQAAVKLLWRPMRLQFARVDPKADAFRDLSDAQCNRHIERSLNDFQLRATLVLLHPRPLPIIFHQPMASALPPRQGYLSTYLAL